MMIPKGSSVAKHDEAFLGTQSVHAQRCVFCGAPTQNDHHHPPKSHVPKDMQHLIPTYSVCGFGNVDGCHGLLHHNGGSITPKPTNDPRYLYALADVRAVDAINARRKRYGLKPVKARVEFMAQAHTEDSPEFEKERTLAELQQHEEDARRHQANSWRERAEYVAQAFALCEKRAEFREWRAESGIPSHEAGRMLKVCAHLERGDLRDVPERIQVLAAKAVADGGEYEDILADAQVLSESDCKVAWFGAPEPADKRECPTCHTKVPKERLEEGE